MTMQERTGFRSTKFSEWIRMWLPDSMKGYMCTDLDFVLYNFVTKKVMLLEIKTYRAGVPKWQAIFIKNMDRWMRSGVDLDWQYLGYHSVIFEKESADDGSIQLDGKYISQNELIKLLTF